MTQLFPSPCGVLVDCDKSKPSYSIKSLKFPSPCGVLVDCDSRSLVRMQIPRRSFNPLAGC